MENIEIFRKKLLYKASHRGTKEMDILMGNFADKFIQLFDDHESVSYTHLTLPTKA